MSWRKGRFACLAAAVALASVAPGAAQDGSFLLELNNSQDLGGACRLIFVARNGTAVVLEKTAYEVAVFDSDQKVSQMLVLEFGRVAVGKTKVVQFDLANLPCDKISRLLVNEIADCVVAGQATTLCMDSLKAATRSKIGFGL